MRLLAIDPGSINAGAAAFVDDRPIATRHLRPRSKSYAERLDLIVDEVVRFVVECWPDVLDRGLDVLALEGNVLHAGPQANPKTLATMSFTRGFLVGGLWQYVRFARYIEVSPQKVKAAAGAPRRRELALEHMQACAMALMRTDRVISVDEAAAIWVGAGAIAILREERMERAADQDALAYGGIARGKGEGKVAMT